MTRNMRNDPLRGQPADLRLATRVRNRPRAPAANASSGPTSAGTVSSSIDTSWE